MSLGLRIKYRKAKRHRSRAQGAATAKTCRWSSVGVRVLGLGLGNVKKVQWLVGRKTMARRSKGPFTVNIRSAKLRKKRIHSRRLGVRVRLKDGSLRSMRRTLRTCR